MYAVVFNKLYWSSGERVIAIVLRRRILEELIKFKLSLDVIKFVPFSTNQAPCFEITLYWRFAFAWNSREEEFKGGHTRSWYSFQTRLMTIDSFIRGKKNSKAGWRHSWYSFQRLMISAGTYSLLLYGNGDGPRVQIMFLWHFFSCFFSRFQFAR